MSWVFKQWVFKQCSRMIFVTLFMYWQVPYPTGHNPYGSNES